MKPFLRRISKAYSDDSQAIEAWRLVDDIYKLEQGTHLWQHDWDIDHKEKVIYIADDSLWFEKSNENAAAQFHQILSDVFYEDTGMPESWGGFIKRELHGVSRCAIGATTCVGGAFLLAVPAPTVITQVGGVGAVVCGANETIAGATQIFRRQGGVDLIQGAAGFCGDYVGGEKWDYRARYWTSWGQLLFTTVGVLKGARFFQVRKGRGMISIRQMPQALRQAHPEAHLLNYVKAHGVARNIMPGQGVIAVADSSGFVHVFKLVPGETLFVSELRAAGINLVRQNPVIFASDGVRSTPGWVKRLDGWWF